MKRYCYKDLANQNAFNLNFAKIFGRMSQTYSQIFALLFSRNYLFLCKILAFFLRANEIRKLSEMLTCLLNVYNEIYH